MKQLLLFLLSLSVTALVTAQTCTPSWPSGGGAGIMPDSATNLPTAHETQAYEAVVQFKVPLDTITEYNGADVPVTISNITITNVTGLNTIPADVPFNYVSTPSDGVFPGGSLGCVLIKGTPAAGSSGQYPIVVEVTANGTITGTGFPIPPQDNTIDYYRIVVDNNLSAALVDARKSGLTVQPSLVTKATTVLFYSAEATTAQLNVVNTLGQMTMTKSVALRAGSNQVELALDELSNGQYLVTLTTPSQTAAAKLMLNR